MLEEAEYILGEPALVSPIDILSGEPEPLHLPVVLLAHGPASPQQVPVDHLQPLVAVGRVVVQVVVSVGSLLRVFLLVAANPRVVRLHLLVKVSHG